MVLETSGLLQLRNSLVVKWWLRRESNPHLQAYEARVLPLHYRAEPHAGFEPASLVWKTSMLPLHQWGEVSLEGIEPSLPVPKTGVMPVHYREIVPTRRWVRHVQIKLYLAPPRPASPARALPAVPLNWPFSAPISLARC